MEFFLGQLSDEVALRMTRIGSNVKGKQIVLKVMIRAANAPAGIRTTEICIFSSKIYIFKF